MLTALTRLFRPRPPGTAAVSAMPPAAAATAEAAAVGHGPHDPEQDLPERFLAMVLGQPEAFASEQVAPVLARMQLLSGADGFRSLRVPRLPAVVPLLLQALRDDDAGLADVARLAVRDPLLVGELMRVANSAYYRGGAPLRDLPHAVQRLGRDGVRGVVARVLLRPIETTQPGSPAHAAAERLRSHAGRIGIACAALASGNRFDAQLAGIAGAVGSSLLLAEIARQAQELRHAQAVQARFLEHAWRLSAHAARAWDFPPDTVAALQAHASGEAASGLARALGAAERLAMLHALDPSLPATGLQQRLGLAPGLALERAWIELGKASADTG